MSLSHDIAIVVAWMPSDCLKMDNSNVHSNNVNYWWETLGRWQYESRNSSPWRYKFKKSRDKNKNHTRLVFCSTRAPSEITKAETLRPSDSGFLLGDFFGGSGWTEYLSRWFFSLGWCAGTRGAFLTRLHSSWFEEIELCLFTRIKIAPYIWWLPLRPMLFGVYKSRIPNS